MLLETSLIEEVLRANLGIKFGKLILREFELTTSVKHPQGRMVRKTTITEIIRNGQVITSHIKKGLISVI